MFGKLSGEDRTNSVAIQPDGRIVVAGYTYNGSNHDFALARYLGGSNANIRTPFDFDGDRKTDLSIFRPSPGEWWINRSLNGSTFALQFGAGTDTIAPDGNGLEDLRRCSNILWPAFRNLESTHLPQGYSITATRFPTTNSLST